MNKLIKQHILLNFSVAFLLPAVILIVFKNIYPQFYHNTLLIIPFYFAILSSYNIYDLNKYAEKNPNKFHIRYMAWFGIKLVSHIGLIMILLLNINMNKVAFVIVFGLVYIIFTILGTKSSSKILRSNSGKK
jgi:cell division protein FtsW (lipid II flippase)